MLLLLKYVTSQHGRCIQRSFPGWPDSTGLSVSHAARTCVPEFVPYVQAAESTDQGPAKQSPEAMRSSEPDLSAGDGKTLGNDLAEDDHAQ